MRSNVYRRPAALLIVCLVLGAATGQPPVGPVPEPPALPGVVSNGLPLPPVRSSDAIVAPEPMLAVPVATVAPAPPPPPPSVDSLIESLTKLRAEKTELERREREMVKALQDRLREQNDRLKKLGIDIAPKRAEPVPPPTAPVGLPAADSPMALEFRHHDPVTAPGKK